MRKIFLILLTTCLLTPVYAQKYACVNLDYIMHNLPDYTQALNKLQKYTEEWSGELENKQQELDELRQQFQQESYLLPDNLKQRRQDEIHTKESELRALQRQRFAPGGDLDQKRTELLKPLQDRIYTAIERVAKEKSYAFVFDKSASATVLYVSDKYDISDQILELLGVKPGSVASSEPSSPASSGSRGNSRSAGDKNSAPAGDARKR